MVKIALALPMRGVSVEEELLTETMFASSQSVESGECVDVPGFFDTYFDGCGWYAAAALVYWST